MGRERKNGKGIRNYGVQVIMGNTCCCGGVAVSRIFSEGFNSLWT
jgi:hypothetical protein